MGWGVIAELVICLPQLLEAPGSIPTPRKPGLVAHTWKPKDSRSGARRIKCRVRPTWDATRENDKNPGVDRAEHFTAYCPGMWPSLFFLCSGLPDSHWWQEPQGYACPGTHVRPRSGRCCVHSAGRTDACGVRIWFHCQVSRSEGGDSITKVVTCSHSLSGLFLCPVGSTSQPVWGTQTSSLRSFLVWQCLGRQKGKPHSLKLESPGIPSVEVPVTSTERWLRVPIINSI